ncbi:MAG: serine/threonine-protein kinase [Planctomycetota bacterium]
MQPTDTRETTARGFRRTLSRDRERGVTRPLAEYLRLFPLDERTIAEEYLAAQRDEAPLIAGRELPARLGRFRLEREIGRGGQARVFLAEDEGLGRPVALKILDLGAEDAEEPLLRFRREAEITSRLHHPGLCPVHDTGTDDGFAWIAMRYIAGESLAGRIRRARLAALPDEGFIAVDDAASSTELALPRAAEGPGTREELREMIRVVEKAARAVHAAHEAGVIHRDIKPGNVMIAEDGQPVVLDFGLARRIEDARHGLTQIGIACGSPAYAAPEQLLGRGESQDRRVDVWGLGITLYEAVTHRRPFRATHREALMRMIVDEEAPEPRSINPLVPTDLSAVIAKAMAKDPERRYATALELAEDLRRILDYEPVRAQPSSPLLRFRRWCRRRPGTAAAMCAVFVLLVSSLATTTWLLHRESVRSAALAESARALEIENGARRELVEELERERRAKEAFFDLALDILSDASQTVTIAIEGATETGAARPPRFRGRRS